MNPSSEYPSNRGDYFWYPYHPILRWPAVGLGLVLLGEFVVGGITTGHWKSSAAASGLLFLSTALSKPSLRRKRGKDRLAPWLLGALVITLGCGVAWIVVLGRH
jgi:hypothetical protein